MHIVLGGDHAGYEHKAVVLAALLEKGHNVDDMGSYSAESCEYPDFAHPVAKAIQDGKAEFGILICGSANGVSMVANKYPNVRAAIAWLIELAQLARMHNDANILCIPARYISKDEVVAFVDTFLTTEFEGGRHERRVAKIAC